MPDKNYEDPISYCPRCDKGQPDMDGFGVVYCAQCGFCEHVSYTADICDTCGAVWDASKVVK